MNTSPSSRVAAPARWRQITATAAVFVAALSVGTTTATTAEAKPKKPGVNEYNNCLRAHIPDASKASDELIRVVQENCCLDLGGTFNEMNGLCYLPNGQAADSSTPPPPPPPGATAVPPPGALNPTGLE